MFATIGMMGLIVGRLTFLQVIRQGVLHEKAEAQQTTMREMHPLRGRLLDAQGQELAFSVELPSLYMDPQELRKSSTAPLALAKALGWKREELEERMKAGKRFVWLKRQIPVDESRRVLSLGLPGVGSQMEFKRFYPKKSMAAHLIGFVGMDHSGLEGLEMAYDRPLGGSIMMAVLPRDARGRPLLSDARYVDPQPGDSFQLTVDATIQHIAETELGRAYQRYHAKAASVMVMDPSSGAILAMANYPTFDPNQFTESSKEARRNRAVTDAFEPGSTFKLVTMAAALQEEAVKEDDKVFCENGEYAIFDHVIHDHEKRGTLTVRDVFGYSSNVGTVKIGMKIGPKILHQYAKAFGFGRPTGVDMPGEARGVLREPRQWSRLSMTSVPIGQEVSVSVVQLVAAYAAVANKGRWVTPHFMSTRLSSHGKVKERFEEPQDRRVITEKTAERLTALLRHAVEQGTGQGARVEGFEIAGKTGTAQKSDAKRKEYMQGRYVSSFIGFFPASAPRYVMAVIIDEPDGVYWGGSVAAPAFQAMAKRIAYTTGMMPATVASAKP